MFISKILPIAKLDFSFFYKQIKHTTDVINQSSDGVKAAICSGNRNNQVSFRLLDTKSHQPWLTKGGIYLLHDFVHLLKNIRNNWLVEKKGELICYERGTKK